jgi:hypothetical protein
MASQASDTDTAINIAALPLTIARVVWLVVAGCWNDRKAGAK